MNYREYDDDGYAWWNTWHRGLKTRRGMEAWLERHGYLRTDKPNVWQGTEFPYKNEATVYTWEELPEHVRETMLRDDLGPNS